MSSPHQFFIFWHFVCQIVHSVFIHQEGSKLMVQHAHYLSFLVAALLGLSLLTGCATDQEARDMAQSAMDAAHSAQSCCQANEERINRMYQKIMSK
jgi:uncharacterized membrane protein (DUF106 family)